jgi:transposase-like protein
MNCPDCKASSGMPYKAATAPNGGTHVDLRCHNCGREWAYEMPPSDSGRREIIVPAESVISRSSASQ